MPDFLSVLKIIVLFPVAMVLLGFIVCSLEGSSNPDLGENWLFGLFRPGVFSGIVLCLFVAPTPLWMHFRFSDTDSVHEEQEKRIRPRRSKRRKRK